jgi:hypothetical protein
MNPIGMAETDIMNNHLTEAQNLIKTAGEHIKRAKELHDELETFYIGSMDFTKVDAMYQKIVNYILGNEL